MAPIISPQGRLKVSLKMAISKLRFTQTKKTALTKQQRRQMAELLSVGKEESAKIRVENIIREDIHIELLEIIELYCELLLARIGLLDRKECDSGLVEAVKTIIYAAPHTDVKELLTIRDLLAHKFGPEFTRSAVENEGGVVPEKIAKRVSVEAPSPELVTLYLKEIARAYDVPFSELSEEEFEETDDGSDGEGGRPILLEDPIEDGLPVDAQNLTPKKIPARNIPNLNEHDKSPISVRPPHKTSDNPNPSVKVPREVEKNVVKQRRNTGPRSNKNDDQDSLDALRKRFEALKR